MFINGNSQFTPPAAPPEPIWTKPGFTKKALIAAGVLLLIGGIGIWVALSRQAGKLSLLDRTSDQTGPLPKPFLGLDTGSGGENKQPDLKAEEIFFGNNFVTYDDKPKIKAIDIAYPLNIKAEVANFYDFTRQIPLKDAEISELSTKGYVVIDNPFAKTSNNFLPVYKELNNHKLPFLVTADFLFYYTQNYLKGIYKNIEADLFYRTFWQNNATLFQQADKRYRDRYAKLGVINDPVLEGLRLEAVFFATNLELLRPKAGQILPPSKESVITQSGVADKFTQMEAQEFQFTVPDYLAQSVAEEIALIKQAGRVAAVSKSPALLYQRNYTAFKIPEDYSGNPKLSNFYLATIWSRSEFPLFYIDKDCPTCLLDKEDWLVNQTAAHLIARDISANQELKNKWAKIYKAIAFFTKLSSELSYLDYNAAFKQLFGEKRVEDVFDSANPTRETDLLSLRNLLAANAFDPAKGAFNRQTEEGRRESGFRVLQEVYDPAKYLYDRLIYKSVGTFINYDSKKIYPSLNTLCESGFHVTTRCRAIGLDIINPLFNETIDNPYYDLNTNFTGYTNQVPYLRNHFIKFGVNDWHDNIYWSTLDVGRKYLNNRKISVFPYSMTPTWANQALSTVLAATTNSYLPLDVWTPTSWQVNALKTPSTVKYHYVEPNLVLISEMEAMSQMLFKTFINLEIVKDNDNEFVNLTNDLDKLRQLVYAEQEGTDFTNQDWLFLNDLVSKFTLKSERNKTWRLRFTNPDTKREALLEQSMAGVKLLVEVQRQQSRNIMVVGPVFSFHERKL
ncbi:MAG: DUF3160 domain-containing protein [Candidatus Falkowbacteria bacterium]